MARNTHSPRAKLRSYKVPKETGIIMSGDHPVKCLDGTKTMTRRVIKPQPISYLGKNINRAETTFWKWAVNKPDGFAGVGEWVVKNRLLQYCPYGQVGDRLWVRETHCFAWDNTVIYRADGEPKISGTDQVVKLHWKPSRHMFRKDSRILLEITSIRVERVQEITRNDAKCEAPPFPWDVIEDERNYRYAFLVLWNSFKAKRGHGWEINPWVWVITFRLLVGND